MKVIRDYSAYGVARAVGFIVCRLPAETALRLGRAIGLIGYYLDRKHKAMAYANLKIAFAKTKKPSEIKRIVKKIFQNYGENIIELLRVPVIKRIGAEKFVKLEGRENVDAALKKNKGLILLAMHFGSWEMSNLMSVLTGHPYRVVAKPQTRFTKLDELLNSLRLHSGSVVIARGRGTREIIESLRKNEIIGMVVDQGGRDGALVKFFGRLASMSVGAIKMGIKYDIPVCFSIIIREKNSQHRLVIHPALEFVKSGDLERDVISNLNKIINLMEGYITQYPSEYMWFYKIWKYSKEATAVILDDGKAGHLRQSQAIAGAIKTALAERGIQCDVQTVDVCFKSRLSQMLIAVLSFISHPFFCQGRLRYLKWFLTRKSFLDIASVKADFVVSCGSSAAPVNFFLSRDYRAKSISILKPGILGFRRFDLVVLPQHDNPKNKKMRGKVIYAQGAPNLINEAYLKEQARLLLNRFSHLQSTKEIKVGILLGGDTKKHFISEGQIKILIGQVKNACEQNDADILITTSRRTPAAIENILQREIKNHPRCRMLILANRSNIPEAVGGILGLCDILVVSGDSVSMVSEAASSGKDVIVFPPLRRRKSLWGKDKHDLFIENLHNRGHIVLSKEKDIGEVIASMARNKIKTKILNDGDVILGAAREVI